MRTCQSTTCEKKGGRGGRGWGSGEKGEGRRKGQHAPLPLLQLSSLFLATHHLITSSSPLPFSSLPSPSSRRLYKDGEVIIIDVSQSVEADHPRALEFLRMDCQNITDYFRKNGVLVITPRELFDFIVHIGLKTDEQEEAFLDECLTRASERTDSGKLYTTAAEEVEHGVFMQAYIPRSLAAVRDAEDEVARVLRGDTAGMYHAAMTGAVSSAVPGGAKAAAAEEEEKEDKEEGEEDKEKQRSTVEAAGEASSATAAAAPLSTESAPASAASSSSASAAQQAEGEKKKSAPAPSTAPAAGGEGSDSEDDDEDQEDGSSDGEEGEEGEASGRAFVKKGASKEERKAHKAAVKAEKREKRKTKIPKHVKRKHEKQGTK